MFKSIAFCAAIAVTPMLMPSQAQARHPGAPCRGGVGYAPARVVTPLYRSNFGAYPVYGNRYGSGYRGGVGLSIGVGSGGFGYPGAYRGGAFGPGFGPGFGYGGFGGFGPGLSLRIR